MQKTDNWSCFTLSLLYWKSLKLISRPKRLKLVANRCYGGWINRCMLFYFGQNVQWTDGITLCPPCTLCRALCAVSSQLPERLRASQGLPRKQNVKMLPVSAWAFSRSQATNSCDDCILGQLESVYPTPTHWLDTASLLSPMVSVTNCSVSGRGYTSNPVDPC